MDGQDRGDNEGYSLVLPFVVTQSHGGPYEDTAFVAGYQCGEIARALAVAAALNSSATSLRFTVRSDLVPQLELIAMNAGFPSVAAEASDAWPEWTTITFSVS